MQYAQPELWREFYLTMAGSAAALVGLLFVANSLHVEKLRSDKLLHRRARNVSLIMMLLFLQSLVVLMPQDHSLLLGVEIFVLNVIMAYFPISVLISMLQQKLPLPITRIGPDVLCPIAGMVGGIMLIMNWRWSIHVVAVSNAIAIFILVANAWSMMLGAWRTDTLKPSK